MSWRFYPLREHPQDGILHRPGADPVVAHFYTPQEAREAARQKAKAA